jgi:hypothetical protein
VIVQDSFPLERLTLCVVRDGALADVTVWYNPATGDSVYEGRLFRDAFPMDSTFAASARWFHEDQTLTMDRRRYVIYGLPRALRPGDVVARGEFRGVRVFAEPGASAPFEVVYLPVRPTCEFQPYETHIGGAVRG